MFSQHNYIFFFLKKNFMLEKASSVLSHAGICLQFGLEWGLKHKFDRIPEENSSCRAWVLLCFFGAGLVLLGLFSVGKMTTFA